jgi:homeobox-leucine zipper protein
MIYRTKLKQTETENFFAVVSEPGSTEAPGRGFDVNRLSMDDADERAAISSPNSAASSFQMDFGIRSGRDRKIDLEAIDAERASYDEENGLTRKKLRLFKEQSDFLEESFNEDNTLNPVSHHILKNIK